MIDALRKSAKAAPGRAFAEHLTDLVTDARDLSEDRREHVDAVAALGREYLAAEGSTGSVAGFLEYLRASLRGGDDGGLHDDAVDLLTFHRAKGLEWDTVFVTGLERGLVPISHASGKPGGARRGTPAALRRAEPGRAPPARSAGRRSARAGNRVSNRTKSPYLAEIERAIGGAAPPRRTRTGTGAGAAGARRAARRRSRPASSRSTDRPLYDALVAWRRELARAAAVPAYVILDNKTLRNVASTRPRSSDALLALPGIGPVKLERYGAALLEVVGRAFRLTSRRSGRTMTGRDGRGAAQELAMHMRSTFPLFPTDDGWPYPDADADDRTLLRQGFTVDDDVDLDALAARRELARVRRPHGHGARRARPALLAGRVDEGPRPLARLHARRGGRGARPGGRQGAQPPRPRLLTAAHRVARRPLVRVVAHASIRRRAPKRSRSCASTTRSSGCGWTRSRSTAG